MVVLVPGRQNHLGWEAYGFPKPVARSTPERISDSAAAPTHRRTGIRFWLGAALAVVILAAPPMSLTLVVLQPPRWDTRPALSVQTDTSPRYEPGTLFLIPELGYLTPPDSAP